MPQHKKRAATKRTGGWSLHEAYALQLTDCSIATTTRSMTRQQSESTVATTAPSTGSTSLLDLPAELRNRIYYTVAHDDEYNLIGPRSPKHASRLSQVNRQIRAENIPVEYAVRILYLSGQYSHSDAGWIALYGQDRIPLAKRISFIAKGVLVRVQLGGWDGQPYAMIERHVLYIKDENDRTRAVIGSCSDEHATMVEAFVRPGLVVRGDGSVYLSAETALKIVNDVK